MQFQLHPLDWCIIVGYILIAFLVGLYFSRRAGRNIEEYFVAGRSLPWWLAGTSIAATWFASDAPLLVSSLIRNRGIYGCWMWWHEAAGGLLLVFFFAKLWRRSGVLTDAEFIELRYAGYSASALRGFTAIFQGVLRNCLIMGWVMIAMTKFCTVMLGWHPATSLAVLVVVALTYTVLSGLWGVVVTDLIQFVIAMIGSLLLTAIVLNAMGGPRGLVDQLTSLPEFEPRTLDLLPNAQHLPRLEMFSFVLLIGLLWLRSGQGDGYIAQRLFATKDERQSTLAALWFNVASFILMPWPWVIVGLASLVVFPVAGLEQTPYTALASDPELAYPMMVAKYMPIGLRGMMVASFLAVFMSTMDTHLCWGASYCVNDVYKRFMVSSASPRHYVLVSRLACLVLAVLAALTAWQLKTIESAFVYLLEITSGIALVSLLRWFWWRVNAWGEISAMAGSFLLANGGLWAKLAYAVGLISAGSAQRCAEFYGDDYFGVRALMILVGCTLIWLIVIWLTPPEPTEQLKAFYRRVRPVGWWGPIARQCPDVESDGGVARSWLGWVMGLVCIYGGILGVGHLCLGETAWGAALLALGVAGGGGTLVLIRAPQTNHS